MKRKSLQLDKNHQKKIFSNLININNNKKQIKEQRKNSYNKKRNDKNLPNKTNNKKKLNDNNAITAQSVKSNESKKVFNILKDEDNETEYEFRNFSNTNSNFNKRNYYIDDYQKTFSNRKKQNLSRNRKELNIKYKPFIKKDSEKNLYIPYDREKIINIRNKVHKFLTEEFHKKNNNINNFLNTDNFNSNDNNISDINNLEEEIIRLDQIDNLSKKNSEFDNILNRNKRMSYLIKYQSEDFIKRSKDLEKFLFFTDNISSNQNSKKEERKQVCTPMNNLKYNLIGGQNNFLVSNNLNDIVYNDIENEEEKNMLNNLNKNTLLKESFKRSINSNQEIDLKLNKNSKEYLLKKIDSINKKVKKKGK